ncbi:MAG: hypothetical protein QW331_02290 [Candidatus Woesearchaeota archaeon]
MDDEILVDFQDISELKKELNAKDILNAKNLSKFDLDLLMNDWE